MLRNVVATFCLATTLPVLSAQDLVRWYGQNFAATLRLARSEKKPVLVYFWADSSAHCKAFWSGTLKSQVVESKLAEFVCFGANAGTTEGSALLQRYKIQTLPTLLVLESKSTSPEDAILGSLPPAEVAQQLSRITSDQGTVSALRRLAAADPKDLELLYDLALKLQYVRDTKTAQIHFDSIREADPDGESNGGAQLLLRDLVKKVRSAAKKPSDPKTFDLSSLHLYLKSARPPAISFVAWDWVARVEIARSDLPAALHAWLAAAAFLPAKRRDDWPTEVVDAMWADRSAIPRDEARKLCKILDRCYAPAVKRLKVLAGKNRIEDHVPADEQLFMQLLALARIRYLAGERKGARELVNSVLSLEPGSGDFQSLDRMLKSESGN